MSQEHELAHAHVTVADTHPQHVRLRTPPRDRFLDGHVVRALPEPLVIVGLPKGVEAACPAKDIARIKRSKVNAPAHKIDNVNVGPVVQVLGYEHLA